jgi:hypothetical protein
MDKFRFKLLREDEAESKRNPSGIKIGVKSNKSLRKLLREDEAESKRNPSGIEVKSK